MIQQNHRDAADVSDSRAARSSEGEPLLSGQTEAKTGGRFRKKEHLKKNAAITRVFKNGRIVNCSGCKLFFLANELNCNRIAFSFVRKYGNAVRRNRVRRLGREAYRLMKEELKTGYDLVLLYYPHKDENRGTLTETKGQLITLFKKAGIMSIKER